MAKVKAYVYVLVGGASKLLRPGDTVPDGVTIRNPDVLADEPKAAPAEKLTEDAPEPAPAPKKRAPRKAADS